jgi:DNA adenine methylase
MPAKPFLRWAGSKRKQLGRLRAFWSDKHTGYVEPFAGSACLFFSIEPSRAVLGDTNLELVELYEVVRDDPDRLCRRLCHIRRDLNTYERWRSLERSETHRLAAAALQKGDGFRCALPILQITAKNIQVK